LRVVTLLGSPRPKGNSATLANIFSETAEKLGATVQAFALNKLSYRGCQACEMCKTRSDRCAIKDDLTQVLDAIRDADILVLATPVYFCDVSGQMKSFIDRCFSYLVPDFLTNPESSRLAPGKKMVFIQTQNQPDETMFADIFPKYDLIFHLLGFKDNYLIRGCDLREADDLKTKNREDLLTLARETARKLLSQRP
jgi:multimeric flavodoxin WrbA